MNMPDRWPSCSVIITTCNRPDALAVTLDDMSRQPPPPDEDLPLYYLSEARGSDFKRDTIFNLRGFCQVRWELVRGWKLASRKLAEGPRHARLVVEE